MDRLTERLESATQTLITFKEILDQPFSLIVRDAAIQRFEFTLEACWKLAQLYLYQKEGLELNSPKAIARGFFQILFLDEKETSLFIQMVDDRNLSTHTYNEELANTIFKHLPAYLKLLQKIVEKIRNASI